MSKLFKGRSSDVSSSSPSSSSYCATALTPYCAKRGFTLIELLVVIAIIGILSSVVLVSLNSARVKAANTSIKSNLTTIRGQAELWYDDNGNKYGPVGTDAASADNCKLDNSMFADPTITAAINKAKESSGSATGILCGSNGTSYAASVPLKDDATKSWCVDNMSNSMEGIASYTSPTFQCVVPTSNSPTSNSPTS